MNDITGVIWEGTQCTVLARIRGHEGEYPTIDTTEGIEARIFRLDGLATPTEESVSSDDEPLVLDQADCMTATGAPIKDARWTLDRIGWNCQIVIPGDRFPTAGSYRVQVKIQPTDGEPYPIVVTINARELFGQ